MKHSSYHNCLFVSSLPTLFSALMQHDQNTKSNQNPNFQRGETMFAEEVKKKPNHQSGAVHISLMTNKQDRSISAMQKVSIPAADVIVLNDNDEKMSIWHCLGPYGERAGPFSMSVLRRWSESAAYGLEFKVWKTGQSEKEAILLTDALSQKVSIPTATADVIELSDDDDEEDVKVAEEMSIWHCLGPCGERAGPFSMSVLRRWSESAAYGLEFKVWKTGQSEKEAILLTDALNQKVSIPTATADVIELSDDDDEEDVKVAEEMSIWHCLGPCGERGGPFSMSVLKRWSESATHPLDFKFWKTGQSEKEAVLLTDALRISQ